MRHRSSFLLGLLATSACHHAEVLVAVPPPAWLDPKVEEQGQASAPGGARVGDILHGMASGRTEASWYVLLDNAHCYWFSAVGGDGVDKLSLSLRDPRGGRASNQRGGGPFVLTKYCPAVPGQFSVKVKTGGPAGVVGVGVYAVAPDAVAATETVADNASAEPDVAVPEAVVAEDPTIPMHEAVVGTPYMPADFTAPTPPPEPVVEDPPPQPDPSTRWIPGYWWWSTPLNRYVWVSGTWRTSPPGETWTQGSWVDNGESRYIWSPGVWAAADAPVDNSVITLAPPSAPDEDPGAPPDALAIWQPGYFLWAPGGYAWYGGGWGHPPEPGLGYVSARYAYVGGRYHYQPGRWDRAPELRGTVYRADINVRPGAHLRPVALPPHLVAAHAGYVTASARVVAHGGAVRAGAPVHPVATHAVAAAPAVGAAPPRAAAAAAPSRGQPAATTTAKPARGAAPPRAAAPSTPAAPHPAPAAAAPSRPAPAAHPAPAPKPAPKPAPAPAKKKKKGEP